HQLPRTRQLLADTATAVGPAPEPEPPAAPAWRPDLAVLDQPALTGLPPGGAAALAAALAVPHAARREARLHAQRGGRDRKVTQKPHSDRRHKMTLAGHALAAVLHLRFGLPARALAALFGCDRTTIAHQLPRTRQLLADTATAVEPAPVTLATLDDLRGYAARHGITITGPSRPADAPQIPH
ncbi:MAG TPA: hypothetical protein VKG80_15835, partial [Trebonia sp.]|nr:hypothetical protein [Trebonia sp.]